MSFNVRWNYRDARRNKFRALMTIVGVMGCTALLVSSFGLSDSMDDLIEWNFNQIKHYDSELIIDDVASQSEIDEVAREVSGDEVMQKMIEIESPLNKKSGELLVWDGTDLITPTDENRNPIEIKDDEISISRKMADLLGVGVGDTVKWHCMDSDKWVESKIDKIHADPKSQGIIMSKHKLQDLGVNYTPTSIVTDEHVDKNYSAIKSSITKEHRIGVWSEMVRAAWVLITILTIFAALLSVIVLYNLGLLSFTEIERQIATLKVLGFNTGALRGLLLTQNLWFSVIGFIFSSSLFALKTSTTLIVFSS